MEKEKIGKVFKYFAQVQVAAIELTDGTLTIGETLQFQGPSTDFTQKIESMQIEKTSLTKAEKGQSVGLKVSDRVREGDLVFRVKLP